jgi:methionyl-tRNA formyltransferase
MHSQASYKIVFMGTPDFAVPSLEALHRAGHELRSVVTQPDRPKGRGRRVEPPPVKKAALALGLPVLQVTTLRDEAVQRRLAEAQADFFIVVAFGHILTPPVLSIPRHGCINVHASLLPKYRGPAPIHWSIINGETETGVSVMQMDKGLDTGDVLATVREGIGPEDTTGSLHDRLARRGAEALVRTLAAWAEGTVRRTPQDNAAATYAPLLRKSDGLIDWRRPACKIEAFIRGMTPWPGAFTFLGGRRLKVYGARVAPGGNGREPGTVTASGPEGLMVATGSGSLCITEIQGASGNRLSVAEFLRGHRILPGSFFT